VIELLARCDWPDLPERYDAALREAVGYIVGRWEVTGIVASGTIVRGTPDASSDFDLYVVHRAPVRQRVQKRFRGVPAEIFRNPPETIRRYFADEHAEGRPSTAHMLATGHVVLSLDPVVETLRAEARDWLARPAPLADPDAPAGRYGPATLYEDAVDVAGRDPATADFLLAQAVPPMLHFAFRRAGHFIPRNKDLFAALNALDPELGALARRFYAAASTDDRLRIAGEIADRTIGARGFFEWESRQEPLSVTSPVPERGLR
jgi:predicted nucleotidyltransferase